MLIVVVRWVRRLLLYYLFFFNLGILSCTLPDGQAGFRKSRGTGDQIANIRWFIEKARDLKKKKKQPHFFDYTEAFDYVRHNKLENSERDGNIRHHLTCLLRNLYAGQEATVKTGHGTTDWLQVGKGVRQSCILSPCLFNFYAEYIMRNAGLDESQAGIKIAGRNINNLRYADNMTLMAESKEELKSLLVRMKERSEEVGLKWDSLVAQMVKNLPAMQEIWLLFLSWEEPLEKGMATHPRRIPWTEELSGL